MKHYLITNNQDAFSAKFEYKSILDLDEFIYYIYRMQPLQNWDVYTIQDIGTVHTNDLFGRLDFNKVL